MRTPGAPGLCATERYPGGMSAIHDVGMEPIVDVATLRDMMDGEHPPVIADVRFDVLGGPDREGYLRGHIPGAIFVDIEQHGVGDGAPGEGRHPFPTDDDFAQSMSDLGIGFDDVVIAYGSADAMGAARLVTMLRLVGVKAALLDGGFEAWGRAGGEVSREEHTREPVVFTTQPFVRLVGIDEVGHASLTRGAALVDARSRERFVGDAEPLDPRPGHIPHAVNVPYSELMDGDGLFKSREEIRALYAERGITPSRMVFNYCGSGMSASVAMLAMDYAGFEHAYLFPGSYSQWSRSPERPVETGEGSVAS